jgi:hypothetical protein
LTIGFDKNPRLYKSTSHYTLMGFFLIRVFI